MLVAMLSVGGNAWCEDAPSHPHRNVIPADETHGAPPGFHAEQETRVGPLIAGVACVAFGALSLNYGIEQHVKQTQASRDPQDSDSDSSIDLTPIFIIGGVAMIATGIPLFTYGLVSKRDVYVRDKPQSLSLRVAPGLRSVGASVSVNF